MSDTYQYLRLGREGDVVVCAINNPPRNYLNSAIVSELSRLVDDVGADESIRALIITGGVDGIFVTHYAVGELGALAEMMKDNPSIGADDRFHGMNQVLLKLQRLRLPVIAAINGTAMGGGCELALACDFRLMARGEGRIGLPEVRVGILPGAGGTQRMTRLLGIARATELILLGNTVDADTAERVGLVHRAVEPDQLLSEALGLAAELASRPPESVAQIKQCILQGNEMSLEDGLRFEQAAFWRTMRTEDARRLMQDYLASDVPLDQA
jgi:enoyl-CoA hydratase